MSVVPKKMLEKIQWLESHVEPFNTNAVVIGTTVLEAAAFQTKTEAARAALTAAVEARDASKNATLALKNAVVAADIAAAGIVKQVRVKAETTNNPDVYTLASIPEPATPGPRPAPGTPSDLKVELDGNGALHMTWRCNNPPNAQGTLYQIWRRVGAGTGEFTYLGGVGEKRYVDATVPAGATALTYQMQAVRSTSIGMWATFNVLFGTNSVGTMTASVTEAPPSPKMAA